ncbi:putative casparian strip membrane protein [Helianthus annuus]|nr:putative casparian strip membrane protein [Helianthus annuus]
MVYHDFKIKLICFLVLYVWILNICDDDNYRYLVAAVRLQSLWSLSLAMIDVYALCVKRSVRNTSLITMYTIGCGITSTITFAAACACVGITVISNDLNRCDINHCKKFMSATSMAFICWFPISQYLANKWLLINVTTRIFKVNTNHFLDYLFAFVYDSFMSPERDPLLGFLHI